jgi:hypothetical protein
MHVARKHIRLGVSDPSRSAAFYQALLGAAPKDEARGVMVLESDSPPVVLVLEMRARAPRGRRRPGRPTRKARSIAQAAQAVEPERTRATPAGAPAYAEETFALVVTEPEHVGKAAVALWRTGARMRLGDTGIETRDPDGNAWNVRFVPGTKERAIVALSGENGADREKR